MDGRARLPLFNPGLRTMCVLTVVNVSGDANSHQAKASTSSGCGFKTDFSHQKSANMISKMLTLLLLL